MMAIITVMEEKVKVNMIPIQAREKKNQFTMERSNQIKIGLRQKANIIKAKITTKEMTIKGKQTTTEKKMPMKKRVSIVGRERERIKITMEKEMGRKIKATLMKKKETEMVRKTKVTPILIRL